MKNTTVAVIAVIAAVIVIGGGLSVMIGVGKSIVEDKGTFVAETSYAEKISTNTGTQTAGSDKVFILALVTITNEKADDGISNNYYNLQIKSNNITYQCDSWNTLAINHEYRYELKTIGKGASSTSCYVFEIPKGDVSTAEILYDGSCNLSCKTVYKGETTMKANIVYDIAVSEQHSYELTDGSIWGPRGDYKLLELKIKLGCNFEDEKTSQIWFVLTLGGKTYYMDSHSSQLAKDPYVETTITKGQTVTITQVYQIPYDANIDLVKVAWYPSYIAAEGTVTISNSTLL